MPKISDTRRLARRTEIMDAALRCFRRVGYQRTSMADIFAESGLSAGAIYTHFASKEDLLFAVAERILDGQAAALSSRSLPAELSPADVVRTIAAGLRDTAPLDVLIQVWGEATVNPDVRANVHAVIERMRESISAALAGWATNHRGQLPVEPAAWAAAVAPILMSVIPGFALQTVLLDDFDDRAFLRDLGLILPSD